MQIQASLKYTHMKSESKHEYCIHMQIPVLQIAQRKIERQACMIFKIAISQRN